MALRAASLCSVDQEENEDSQSSMKEGRGGEGCSVESSGLKRLVRAHTAALWSKNTELLDIHVQQAHSGKR